MVNLSYGEKSCFPDPRRKTEKISYNYFANPISLEDIAAELEHHEGELVLLDRKRITVENYGEPGVYYLVSPTHVWPQLDREAGILVSPRLIDYRPEKIFKDGLKLEGENTRKFLNRIVAEVTVNPKYILNTEPSRITNKPDDLVKKERENIEIYEEDLDEQTKNISGRRYPTTTHIETFKLMIGNEAVYDFLSSKYWMFSETCYNELFESMRNP